MFKSAPVQTAVREFYNIVSTQRWLQMALAGGHSVHLFG